MPLTCRNAEQGRDLVAFWSLEFGPARRHELRRFQFRKGPGRGATSRTFRGATPTALPWLIMVTEGFVEEPAKFWRRPADPPGVFGGRVAELVDASWDVDVPLVRWRPDAKRNSPVAERASFVEVLGRVFEVLDVLLGPISHGVLEEVLSGRGGGAVISSMLDERAQVRDAITERLSALGVETWIPASTVVGSLEDVFRQRGLRPARVAHEVGGDAGDIIDLIRGDRVPTPEIAERLASLLDVDPTALTARPVDEHLARVLDRPRYWRRLAEKGREQGVVDEGLWRYQVATQQLATAARTTGHGDPVRRWQGLVEAYLRNGSGSPRRDAGGDCDIDGSYDHATRQTDTEGAVERLGYLVGYRDGRRTAGRSG